MIALQGISKRYRTKHGMRTVLKDVWYEFEPGVNVGILGRNGAGKSTTMRIISGGELPDTGRVVRTKSVSWPLGFSGGFNTKITGRENMRFICRLYDKDYKEVTAFVEDFAELGDYFDMPVHTYSSGMKAKLAFGLSMAFKFDYYLIDELTAVGDAAFRQKSEAIFAERCKTATLIVVSHSMETINKLCERLLVLYQGTLRNFASNSEAEHFYQTVCCGKKL